MILKITKNTDPLWKKKFTDIQITPAVEKVVADMQETLGFTMGVGLAAPQVGYPWRMFIVDFADLKETFINPRITKKVEEETDVVEEGCLSIPNYRGYVKRPTHLEIEYFNLKGEHKRAELSGYYARIVQHEYDHLDATFYVDRITNPKDLQHFDPIKIVFFGTGEFSATVLRSLLGQSFVGDYKVQLVVTAPDRPTGRGQNIQSPIVKNMALEFGVEVAQPERLAKKTGDTFVLTNHEILEKISALSPDLLVLASYGKILPEEILATPKYFPLNVHPSLLPKYRGPSPIQTALLHGDKTTGVTIMAMNAKMDEGDTFVRERVTINPNDNYESLSRRLARVSSELLHYVIHGIVVETKTVRGKKVSALKARPQNPEKATYTKMIKKEDGKINWQKPPKKLEQMIRAYYPWPGVWTEYNGKVLKLLPEGKVQLEGKTPMKLKDFVAGHKDFTLVW